MKCSVAVLVSQGRHPASGAPRPADEDARALEMALSMEASDIQLLHAGDPLSPALRAYLGMGVEALTVLSVPPQSDPVDAINRELSASQPDIIFTGTHAEDGEGSGFLPYTLASRLGRPILPNICELMVMDGMVEGVQALPRGQRRALRAHLPVLVTVGKAAPPARQSAFAKARRGQITVVNAGENHPSYPDWIATPARVQPKRLKGIDPYASAADRLEAATSIAGGEAQILTGLSADEAADRLLQYWAERGLLPRSIKVPTSTTERPTP